MKKELVFHGELIHRAKVRNFRIVPVGRVKNPPLFFDLNRSGTFIMIELQVSIVNNA